MQVKNPMCQKGFTPWREVRYFVSGSQGIRKGGNNREEKERTRRKGGGVMREQEEGR